MSPRPRELCDDVGATDGSIKSTPVHCRAIGLPWLLSPIYYG